MYYRYLFLTILLLSFGCKDEGCEIPDEIAEVPVDVTIERLEEPFSRPTLSRTSPFS